MRFVIPSLLALLAVVPASAAGRAVTLVSSDGTILSAMFYEASPRPAPGVVLVHMMGRTKEEWADFAERLQDAGIAAMTVDLRGHGRSGGSASDLPAMTADVQAAVAWLRSQPAVRGSDLALVGASLGANLAAVAAAESPAVRGAALLSPSLDYRGIRLDAALSRKLMDRAVWLAASTDDPYALRTVRELAAQDGSREQRLVAARAHGTALLAADPELGRALVDWLRRTLIS